ncbi:hypothetical protein ACFFQW_16540 [Umezawaea endophytica]|uniref:Antimicrobial peptide system SdpA family protein n=1 Tax=Umezawaea endophytica TaxID=1654476 RepID=A0A9X3A256_9PSEU|nr:hypothetical protein [Umezawaea endophytica]MCS7480359.1 hypothetical protein [Umezawaea endophytica]
MIREDAARGPGEEPEGGDARGLHGFTLTATVLVTSLVLTWLAALDVSGLRDRLQGYLEVWPQRWTFFVDLDRDLLVGYRVDPGSPRLVPLTERRRWSTWSWGLSRAGYAEAAELRAVARRIPDQHWFPCDEPEVLECGRMAGGVTPHRAENRFRDPVLCGRLAITVERSSTLVSHRLPEHPRQVYRIAFVDLECPT